MCAESGRSYYAGAAAVGRLSERRRCVARTLPRRVRETTKPRAQGPGKVRLYGASGGRSCPKLMRHTAIRRDFAPQCARFRVSRRCRRKASRCNIAVPLDKSFRGWVSSCRVGRGVRAVVSGVPPPARGDILLRRTLGLMLLTLGLLVWPATASADAWRSGFIRPTTRSAATTLKVDALQSDIGRPIEVVSWFQSWGGDAVGVAGAAARLQRRDRVRPRAARRVGAVGARRRRRPAAVPRCSGSPTAPSTTTSAAGPAGCATLHSHDLPAPDARDERQLVSVGRHASTATRRRRSSRLEADGQHLPPRGRRQRQVGVHADQRGLADDDGQPPRALLPRPRVRRRPRDGRLQLGRDEAELRRLAQLPQDVLRRIPPPLEGSARSRSGSPRSARRPRAATRPHGCATCSARRARCAACARSSGWTRSTRSKATGACACPPEPPPRSAPSAPIGAPRKLEISTPVRLGRRAVVRWSHIGADDDVERWRVYLNGKRVRTLRGRAQARAAQAHAPRRPLQVDGPRHRRQRQERHLGEPPLPRRPPALTSLSCLLGGAVWLTPLGGDAAAGPLTPLGGHGRRRP